MFGVARQGLGASHVWIQAEPSGYVLGVLLPKLTRTASKMDTYPIKHVLKVFQLLPFETCYFNCGLNHVTTLKGLRFLGDTANELGPGT